MSTDRPIVVGIDGTMEARDAARWSAAEAMRRGAPVLLLHAMVPGDYAGTSHKKPEKLASDWLEQAAADVRAVWPGAPVSARLCDGPAEAELVHQSTHAALVVIGTRGFGRPLESLTDSPAITIARHVECPLVTVPHDRPAPPDGAVVVGVDGSSVSEQATGFAFEEAKLRHCPLVAVHTWSDVALEDDHAVARRVGSWQRIREEEKLLLADRLAGWQRKYPDVHVLRVVTQDRPVRSLLEHAAGAQLLVVGSRGRGGYEGMLLGSTSQALLYSCPCPLAVVRHTR
ncbi:universal stress protein [Fodinicola acaciae]|uniref:universal stress protein n=1 Tax=Fodinicola acaciae TaxID=2681555 RepID=UPI0013D73DD2|nr:universal stress protein [Fodinicola acaciae]